MRRAGSDGSLGVCEKEKCRPERDSEDSANRSAVATHGVSASSDHAKSADTEETCPQIAQMAAD